LRISIIAIFLSRSLSDTDIRTPHATHFSFLIANQVKFESKEPTHGTFTSLSDSLENLVDMYSLVSANTKRSTVHETDSSTFSEKHLLDKQGKKL
jgi:hypothetical protein